MVRKDVAGDIKLDKEKSRRKIDGMVVLVNAVGAAIAHPEEPRSEYEQMGVLWLQAVWRGRRARRSVRRFAR